MDKYLLIDFGLARYIDNEKYMKQEDYWYIGDFLIHYYFYTLMVLYLYIYLRNIYTYFLQ